MATSDLRRIVTVAVVAALAFVGSATLLHLLGVLRVVVGVTAAGQGQHVDYALPPLLPGALLAPLAFALWGKASLSLRRLVGVSLLVALAVVAIRQHELWLHPLTTWGAVRERWEHPYVQEAVYLFERDLVYSLLCTFLAGAAAMGALRPRSRPDGRTEGSPTGTA